MKFKVGDRVTILAQPEYNKSDVVPYPEIGTTGKIESIPTSDIIWVRVSKSVQFSYLPSELKKAENRQYRLSWE